MSSNYLNSDEVISRMALAIGWITDLSDARLIKRELSCAGFTEDEIDQYAECAIVYATKRRALFTPHNQMVVNEAQ